MSDRAWLDIDIINIRFEYSDTEVSESDVEYLDSDTDWSKPMNLDSNTVGKYRYRFLPAGVYYWCCTPDVSLLRAGRVGVCCVGPSLSDSRRRGWPLKPDSEFWKKVREALPRWPRKEESLASSPHGTDIGQTYNKKSTLYDNRFKQRYMTQDIRSMNDNVV
jgi:hypothetical protein